MVEYGNSVIIPSASEAENLSQNGKSFAWARRLLGKISWHKPRGSTNSVVWSMILLMMILQIIPLIC